MLQEKYFGPKLFWIGFCCLGPLFTACAYHTCDCDKRAVYVAPNGVRYPRQKSQLRRFIAVETVWIILLVVLIILNASVDDDDGNDDASGNAIIIIDDDDDVVNSYG